MYRGFCSLYGNELTIKKYAKFPKFMPVYARIQHGMLYDAPLDSDMDTNYSLMLVFNKKDKKNWEKYSNIKALTIGMPMGLFRKVNKITQNSDAKGTIAFPAHSIDVYKASFGIKEYCEKLLNLPEEFHPITVCLYEQDVKLWGIDKEFRAHGFNIVSAGEKYNYTFPQRFYEELKKHKYATSNSLGSCVLYSTEQGLPFFLWGEDVQYKLVKDSAANSSDFDKVYDKETNTYWDKIKAVLPHSPVQEMPEDCRAFLEKECGLKDNTSPFILNLHLWWAYFDYKLKRELPHKVLLNLFTAMKNIFVLKTFAKKLAGKKVCFVGNSDLIGSLFDRYDFSKVDIIGFVNTKNTKIIKDLYTYKDISIEEALEKKPDLFVSLDFDNKKIDELVQNYNFKAKVIEVPVCKEFKYWLSDITTCTFYSRAKNQSEINKLAKAKGISNKNIYLYGAGKYAQDNLKKYNLKKLGIKGVFDSNTELEGQFIEGIEIIHNSKIKVLNPDYILISIENKKPIKNYLNEVKQNEELNFEILDNCL